MWPAHFLHSTGFVTPILREFVNYRHPGPRCVWKGGSEPQFTTSFPVDPVDPVDPLACPKLAFSQIQSSFFSKSSLSLKRNTTF